MAACGHASHDFELVDSGHADAICCDVSDASDLSWDLLSQQRGSDTSDPVLVQSLDELVATPRSSRSSFSDEEEHSRKQQVNADPDDFAGLPTLPLPPGLRASWSHCIMPVVRDGIVVAGQPLPPPAELLITGGDPSPTVVLLVDTFLADVQPLVQLAEAVLLKGRRLIVCLLNWSFASAFKHLEHGLVVLCAHSAQDALSACKASVVLYTWPMRCDVLKHERKHGVPAVMIGFRRAFITTDHPPRPSFKVRDSSDAAFAAELLDELLSAYIETGLFKQLQNQNS